MQLNFEQVKDFLPHRDPFLFIDTVERITTKNDEVNDSKDLIGSKVMAHFSVEKDLKVLEGHFPGNPILPGVVQVEMMAQACAFTSMPLTWDKKADYDVETLLLGVESTKFRKQVVPGMKLQIYTEMIKCRSNIASYNCEIHHEGKRIAEATILARLSITRKKV